jgi:hypothetical protein
VLEHHRQTTALLQHYGLRSFSLGSTSKNEYVLSTSSRPYSTYTTSGKNKQTE